MSNSAHLNMVLLLALGVVVWAGSHLYEFLSARRRRALSQKLEGAPNEALPQSEPSVAKHPPRA